MLKHIGTKTIETDRMILRRFEYSDNASMRKNWISNEKIQSLYSEPTYTNEEEVKELLDKYIGSYSKEDYYRWAIIDKESKECIGQIAFFLVDSKNHFAEIEYCIGEEYQGRGLATEATKSVIAYGFDEINLHKVQICTKTINVASKRVIEKCGLNSEVDVLKHAKELNDISPDDYEEQWDLIEKQLAYYNDYEGFSFFNDAVIFSDYLILGNYTNGVYIIDLEKFEVQRVAIEGYF